MSCPPPRRLLHVVGSCSRTLLQMCKLPHPLNQRSPTFLAPGTGFVEDNFSTFWVGGGDGSGGNASDGERWGATDEAALLRLTLTFCCAARFLTGRRPVPVRSPGARDPCIKPLMALSLTLALSSVLNLGKYRLCGSVGCSPAIGGAARRPRKLL